MSCLFFFFNDTATTEIYTLSLHDALPILFGHGPLGCLLGMLAASRQARVVMVGKAGWRFDRLRRLEFARDRKSTRLNSSHGYISYAVFCLKKKSKRCGCWRGRPKPSSSCR